MYVCVCVSTFDNLFSLGTKHYAIANVVQCSYRTRHGLKLELKYKGNESGVCVYVCVGTFDNFFFLSELNIMQ